MGRAFAVPIKTPAAYTLSRRVRSIFDHSRVAAIEGLLLLMLHIRKQITRSKKIPKFLLLLLFLVHLLKLILINVILLKT